ncbi:MAG: hypothetical protein HOQ35_11490 [Acidobacteriaceae bacterium]|nr:hypothetical protein [Acidobacteriaceae bacterium]
MSFDPAVFEAEVALRQILTEKLPSVAQDALEAGWDGPAVTRMAILNPNDRSEIDQALSPMLAELGLQHLDLKTAAIRLAERRAVRILGSGEDPIPHLGYFYRLMYEAGYPEELYELGYLEDEIFCSSEEPDVLRGWCREALENLLNPEIREKQRVEREAAVEEAHRQAERRLEAAEARRQAEKDWPYVWHSPERHRLLKERLRERFDQWPPLIVLLLGCCTLLGWSTGHWFVGLLLLLGVPPIVLLLSYWRLNRELRYERRAALLRLGYPEEKI